MALVTDPRTGLIPTALICGALAMSAISTMSGCDEADPVSSNVVPVKISGKTFHLELAADEKTRMRGMGGRTSIAEDGGMIFVFTPSQTQVQTFVMRDCPIDIDILYLDGAGRVLTTYTMKAEPRKADGSEGKDGELGTGRDTPADRYEQRLKRYSSRFPSPFVIELAPGTIQKIGVKEGDQVVFDSAGLKRRAR